MTTFPISVFGLAIVVATGITISAMIAVIVIHSIIGTIIWYLLYWLLLNWNIANNK